MKNILLLILALAIASPGFSQTVTIYSLQSKDHHSNCGVTEKELQKAVYTLKQSLRKAGVDVEFGYVRFGGEQPTGEAASPLGLWISNKPIEYWLNADRTAVASNTECPSLKMGNQTYSSVPADLIVKAGLLAAGTLKRAPAPQSTQAATLTRNSK